MKEISLTQGKVALVDDEYFEELNKFKWYAHKEGNTYYAYRKIRQEDGKTKGLYMHIKIMEKPIGLEIDHINRNGLDNRRKNLRICSRSQNQMNKKIGRNNTTGFKGVRRDKKRFCARIKMNGKYIHLGGFSCPIDAALAYDSEARKLFGEFAKTNFPEGAGVQHV